MQTSFPTNYIPKQCEIYPKFDFVLSTLKRVLGWVQEWVNWTLNYFYKPVKTNWKKEKISSIKTIYSGICYWTEQNRSIENLKHSFKIAFSIVQLICNQLNPTINQFTSLQEKLNLSTDYYPRICICR